MFKLTPLIYPRIILLKRCVWHWFRSLPLCNAHTHKHGMHYTFGILYKRNLEFPDNLNYSTNSAVNVQKRWMRQIMNIPLLLFFCLSLSLSSFPKHFIKSQKSLVLKSVAINKTCFAFMMVKSLNRLLLDKRRPRVNLFSYKYSIMNKNIFWSEHFHYLKATKLVPSFCHHEFHVHFFIDAELDKRVGKNVQPAKI